MAVSSKDEPILSPSPHPLIPSTPTPTSFSRRPMSSTLLAFRFGGSSHATRTTSTMPDSSKPVGDLTEDLGRPVWSSHGHDRDPPSSSSRPSTSGSIPGSAASKGHRGNLFTVASDALGIKFGLARRRPPPRDIPAPVVLPDVIDITARKKEEEEEERNRLRVEAAQAIGLVDEDVQSHHISTDEEGVEERSLSTRHGGVHNLAESINSAHYANGGRNAMHASTQTHGSSTSVAALPPIPVGRYRSGSLMGGSHSRSNSANLTPVPPYPATVSSLAQWQQHAGTLPKYYPPSSLRIFALSNSKNWKPRYIMLTSPTSIITRTRAPAVSYLHLFKGSGADEKELERLVINEDSVVFVSDDEVGGRRHVIKVGGIEGGAFKKELNVVESGRTMWFLQIENQAESRQWIAGIKNSILNQRALRAGLLPAAGISFGVNEPRGDIDVMLSMRAQGFITSHSNARQHHSTPPSTVPAAVHAEQNLTYASSISEHSLRSQASSPPKTAVSTLKGLFTGSRPRSGSRAASVDTAKLSSQQQQQQLHDGTTLDSAGAGGVGVGNNLMSMIRSATPDLQSQSSGTTTTTPTPTCPPLVGRSSSPPFVPSVAPDTGIDRQIISPGRDLAANDLSSPTSTRAAKALSLGSMSLQPPPRKRWTSTTAVTPPVALTVNVSPTNSSSTPTEMYKNSQLNLTTGSLGALTYANYNKDLPSEPGSPTAVSMMTGDHNHLHPNHGSSHGHHHSSVRPSSVQSNSTYATSNGGDSSSQGVDRTSSSASTRRTGSSQGARRWSRQGQGSLPPRTSPPAGPPPNPPPGAVSPTTSPVSRSSMVVGDATTNRPSSRASSALSTQSQQSVVSSLPSFSKRTSVSSVGTTSSNSHSANGHGHGVGLVVRGAGGHRSSMPPPPRPAPTSALPPAPGEQPSSPHSPTHRHNQNQSSNSRSAGRHRPRSVDSSVPNPVSKPKRASITGRGFRLSMIAPSKPPPSSNLPPRPDEVGEYELPPSAASRRMSGGQLKLSRLNPIPASPDPNNPVSSGGDTAPFPPPRGPLPPTPETSSSNTTKLSSGLSRHTSLKQRLRILSAPSSSSTNSNQSTNTGGGGSTNAIDANANASSTSAQALSNISNMNTNSFTNKATTSSHNTNSQSHTHTRSFASRFSHSRNSSLNNNNNNNNNNNTPPPSSRLAQSPPPPLFSTPSYLNLSTSDDNSPLHTQSSHPETPLGEKIMSFQEESSFLNLVADAPISPTMSLPHPPPTPPPKLHGGPLSSMVGGMGMSMNMSGLPIRPLPAIPVSIPEMTSLSPPPRRNSKVVIEHGPVVVAPVATKPSPPRTPSTPSIFEDTFGVDAAEAERRKKNELPLPPPHFRSCTFGPSTPPNEKESTTGKDPQKQKPLLLSLPPSPLLEPMVDEMSATPPDTPSCETGYEASLGVSPSSPASIFSLGMKSV